MEACYPHFPADMTVLDSLLSLPDVQVKSQDKLAVLFKFICKMPEIQTILPFLPDFMEFYLWLHRDLAGVLTPEGADKISIKKLVDRKSRHNGESGRKLMSLYKRVKGSYVIKLFYAIFHGIVTFYSTRWLQSLFEGCSRYDFHWGFRQHSC